jgi:hypothetical protein
LNGIGDLGFVTVGAENAFGSSGDNYYVDGFGIFPDPATELIVDAVPGTPGETHTVTFTVKGERRGRWVMYDELTSNLFQGINIERFEGEVTP